MSDGSSQLRSSGTPSHFSFTVSLPFSSFFATATYVLFPCSIFSFSMFFSASCMNGSYSFTFLRAGPCVRTNSGSCPACPSATRARGAAGATRARVSARVARFGRARFSGASRGGKISGNRVGFESTRREASVVFFSAGPPRLFAAATRGDRLVDVVSETCAMEEAGESVDVPRRASAGAFGDAFSSFSSLRTRGFERRVLEGSCLFAAFLRSPASAGRSFEAATRFERLIDVVSAACGMEEASGSVDAHNAHRGAAIERFFPGRTSVRGRLRGFLFFPENGSRPPATRALLARDGDKGDSPW